MTASVHLSPPVPSWCRCADAPAPSWDELESVMLAVKLVVHGLVEFIQNFSKKNHDAPQVEKTKNQNTEM